MAAPGTNNLSIFPNEILERIFLLCSIEDLNTLKDVCKRFSAIINSDYFWQMKWPYLLESSGLSISSTPSCKNTEESYYSCGKRLLGLVYRTTSGYKSLPSCPDCGLKGNCDVCLQEGNTRSVSLDIGSKTTWVVTPHGNIQRHPTVLILPSNEIGSTAKPSCLLCSRKRKDAISGQFLPNFTPIVKSCCEEFEKNISPKFEVDCSRLTAFPKPIPFSDLWLEFPHLYMLHTTNLKFSIFEPIKCFSGSVNIDCLKIYMHHVLCKFKMTDVIKKPNSSFLFCEPFNCTPQLRWKLCSFFFEALQVNRVCLVSKGLAVSFLLGFSECLVIDSGASNTVVYVILNNQLQQQRTQHCPFGGLNIAKDLYVTLQFSGIKKKVYGPSLDSSRLKRSCYLSFNPILEQKRVSSSKQDVFLRFLDRTVPSCDVDVLQMGPELFLAPELHYTALNLPKQINTALEGLPSSTAKLLLSNIVLTGSNTELQGFSNRLTYDLQKAFPAYRNSICLRTNRGGHSWDAAIGAMNVPSQEKSLGSVFWVSREDYILKGPSLFSEET